MEDIISSLAIFNQQMTTIIDFTTDEVIPNLNTRFKSADTKLHNILFNSIPYL